MLLLVGGLVVIVLVILVVVFLSVRSTRADAGDDYPARPTGRGRAAYAAADRGDASPRRPARRRSADDERLGDDDETGFDEPEVAEPEYSQPRSMPRPRGHQHDEDPGSGDRPVNRNDLRRKPGSRPRLSASARDRSGTDWPASDWGGVSDEQYWAELSADKPLATTARSAQPGTDARQAAATRSGSTDPVPADMAGRGGRRASPAAGPLPEQTWTVAAPAAATAQFSFGSADEPAARQPWAAEPSASPEPATFGEPATARKPAGADTPWADPVTGTEGGSDTDPGLAGIADWSGTPGDGGAETTTWSAEDSWGTQVPAAEDTRSWVAEDPLTSPSFSAQSAHATDSRSYRGSTERARIGRDEPAGHAYQPEPAWNDAQADSYTSHADGWTEPGHEFAGGTLEPLPGVADSAIEPVSSWYSAPTPVAEAPSYAAPSRQRWDQGGLHDDDESGRPDHGADQAAGYGQQDPYTDADPQSWQPAGPGYGEAASYGSDYGQHSYGSGDTGYQQPGYGTFGPDYGQPDHGTSDVGYGSDGAGFGQPDHGTSDAGYGSDGAGYAQPGTGSAGYGQPGYGADDTSYGDTGYGSAGTGYGQPGNGSAGSGYGQPGYGTDGNGYRHLDHDSASNGYPQPGHDSPSNGYPQPGHDSPSNGAYQPGYGAAGTGFEDPGYDAAGTGYGQHSHSPGGTGYHQAGNGAAGTGHEGPGYAHGEPGYGQSGFGAGPAAGGPGHGAGYGHYPDYDR